MRALAIAPRCEIQVGTLRDLPPARLFDTILYIDVLEHIEDDRAEIRNAIDRLRPGGHVVVVAPAHGWLFTPFDAAIGHHRRYTRATLAALTPPSARIVESRYLDSVGLLASTANRLLLRQSMPTLRQILLWDRRMVPLSRLLDPVFFWRIGKSVVTVWVRAEDLKVSAGNSAA
jgi:SAM-dependent methyltransferase